MHTYWFVYYVVANIPRRGNAGKEIGRGNTVLKLNASHFEIKNAEEQILKQAIISDKPVEVTVANFFQVPEETWKELPSDKQLMILAFTASLVE